MKSNDKKRARVEALRHVLARIDYTGKDTEIVAQPDQEIVGSASRLFERGEHQADMLRAH